MTETLIHRLRNNLTNAGLALDLYEDPAIGDGGRAFARQALRHAVADAAETLARLERDLTPAEAGYLNRIAS